VRRYTATDHTKFDQSLKHCPVAAQCTNCMPVIKVDPHAVASSNTV